MISDAGSGVGAALNVVWDIITANPILIVFAGAGLVALGFKFFKKAKGVVR